MHFGDVADDAGRQIVLPAPRLVERVALVAHLRDELRIRRGLRREVTRLCTDQHIGFCT